MLAIELLNKETTMLLAHSGDSHQSRVQSKTVENLLERSRALGGRLKVGLIETKKSSVVKEVNQLITQHRTKNILIV